MATTLKATKKSTTAAVKKPRSYPPYSEMINEAITSLKERTGSSQIAISKFIEEKQKANLPTNFKKLLLVQLKKLVANGKLVKVKGSFKLAPKTPSSVKKPVAAKKPKSASAKTIAKKIKSVSTKTATKKPKSTTAAAKKPKTTTTAAKKVKPASTKAKKPVVEKLGKSPAKKAAVAAKAKKPKSIKTPVKKVAATKKAKK